MMPVLLRIGPFTLYSYAVALGFAFLLGGWVLATQLRRRGLDPGRAGPLTLIAVVSGVGGATLLALLEHWLTGPADLAEFLREGMGMTWYGGFVAAAVGVCCYARWHDLPVLRVLDASAPAIALGYGIGRLGCHLAGDGDYGAPTSLPWGVSYAAGVDPPSRRFASIAEIASAYPGGVVPDDVPCHPVPIYELLIALAAFWLLWRLSRRLSRDGCLVSMYLVIAGASRFGVECLRPNPRLLAGLTEPQLIALLLVLVGATALTWLTSRSARTSWTTGSASATRLGATGVVRDSMRARGRAPWCWPAATLALLISGMGCSQTTAFTVTPGDPNNTIWVSGMRFEPSFVQDATQKIGPSYVYWMLAGEPVFVKWQDFHAHLTVDGGLWDCNLCAEMVAQAHGGEVCPLPNGHQPRGTYDNVHVLLTEAPIFTSPGGPTPPPPSIAPQTAGPFVWRDGCFALGPPNVGPAVRLSFIEGRSAGWYGAAELGGNVYGGRPPASATFWAVPVGGQLIMPPRQLVRYTDPSTRQPDPNHWVWTEGVTTDASGKTWWDESFSPGITVGHVRLYTARVVMNDPFIPDGTFLITGVVAPRRIHVSEHIDPNLPIGNQLDLFHCASDAATAATGGDIDLTRCRGDAPAPNAELVTPAYQPSAAPPASVDVRTPLTWVAEFNNSFPAPVLTNGDDLWIEFTLLDAASVH